MPAAVAVVDHDRLIADQHTAPNVAPHPNTFPTDLGRRERGLATCQIAVACDGLMNFPGGAAGARVRFKLSSHSMVA
jgi:hypothetical protein